VPIRPKLLLLRMLSTAPKTHTLEKSPFKIRHSTFCDYYCPNTVDNGTQRYPLIAIARIVLDLSSYKRLLAPASIRLIAVSILHPSRPYRQWTPSLYIADQHA